MKKTIKFFLLLIVILAVLIIAAHFVGVDLLVRKLHGG
jgi:type III secretory pathway component EscS